MGMTSSTTSFFLALAFETGWSVLYLVIIPLTVHDQCTRYSRGDFTTIGVETLRHISVLDRI